MEISSHTNNPKVRSEDHIQKLIRKVAERSHTSLLLKRHEITRTGAVLLERRRRAVQVATAIEFLLQQRLHLRRLVAPDGGEIGASLEGFEPYREADDEGEDGAENYEPAMDSEDDAVRGEEERWEGDEEGEEDEDGVAYGGCNVHKSQLLCLALATGLQKDSWTGAAGR